ncbi:hypothetical protein Tco_1463172 [Tanacetum coccineum]
MRTRSSSNLVGNSSSNPTTSNPKRHNRRRSNQRVEPFALEESPVVTMADQRTMTELLCVPTEGYAEAIVVPPILAEHFELKHSLINMMTSDQFFGLEKDNPHDHMRWFNKITSTIKYKDVPNHAIKLMLFPFSLAGAAHRWLEKEPPLPHLQLRKALRDSVLRAVGSSPYYQCLAADGNTFLIIGDKIQGGYVGLHQPVWVNLQSGFFQMNITSTSGTGSLPSNTIANPKGELKAITTRSGLVLDRASVPMPPPFINLEEDERVEETLTDPEHDEFTIKVPPPMWFTKGILVTLISLIRQE